MNRVLIHIVVGVIFAIGVGMLLLDVVFHIELFSYSALTGFGLCLLAALLISWVVGKEKPNIKKDDLSGNIPGSGG